VGNPVCHFEIGCRDLSRTSDFYSRMFDWQISLQGAAVWIRTGGEIGGHLKCAEHEPQNYVRFYVAVDDVQASLDKAVALGGKALLPVTNLLSGQFSCVADPEGNIIGLFKETGETT
jgi:hypothetical protein